MWTLKYAICGEVLKLNKGFLSSDYAACCLVSMMMLCRNIKRTRLNREDCRDKFYIFNTYFYGKLEEALHPRVRSFVSCRHTSFTKWLAIMSLCKNGIIILFWVRGTWVPCNRSFCSSFFSLGLAADVRCFIKKEWNTSTKDSKEGKIEHTNTPQLKLLNVHSHVQEEKPPKRTYL